MWKLVQTRNSTLGGATNTRRCIERDFLSNHLCKFILYKDDFARYLVCIAKGMNKRAHNRPLVSITNCTLEQANNRHFEKLDGEGDAKVEADVHTSNDLTIVYVIGIGSVVV